MLSMGFVKAQTLSTKETKIVLVVNEKTDEVKHIELFSNFKKITQKEMLSKYPDYKFYIGILQGKYSLDQNRVILHKDATITLYTNKRYLPNEDLFPSDGLSAGDNFTLGKTTTEVISNKKGELILKTIEK